MFCSAQTLPGDATAPGHVRTFVHQHLSAFGHPRIADVQLLASEVVTNAVIHTDCAHCTVHLEVAEGLTRLSVSDCDPDHVPCLLPLDPYRFGGLGMHIVDDLSRRWGWETDASGKTVWFELSHPPV